MKFQKIWVFGLIIISFSDNIGGEVCIMKRLMELRREANLTQAALGKLLNAAQNSVSNWENGTREPSNADLIKLADLFGVSTDYLLERTDDPEPGPEGASEPAGALNQEMLSSPALQELVQVLRQVSPASARKILEISYAFLAQERAEKAKNR